MRTNRAAKLIAMAVFVSSCGSEAPVDVDPVGLAVVATEGSATSAAKPASTRWQRLHIGEKLTQRMTMHRDASGKLVHACAGQRESAEPAKP